MSTIVEVAGGTDGDSEVGVNVARRTIEVLRERGWTQHVLENEEGEVCLVGALKIAADVPIESSYSVLEKASSSALVVLIDVLVENYPNRASPSRFNDTEGRTVEEVIAVLEEVATHFDEQGINHLTESEPEID